MEIVTDDKERFKQPLRASAGKVFNDELEASESALRRKAQGSGEGAMRQVRLVRAAGRWSRLSGGRAIASSELLVEEWSRVMWQRGPRAVCGSRSEAM